VSNAPGGAAKPVGSARPRPACTCQAGILREAPRQAALVLLACFLGPSGGVLFVPFTLWQDAWNRREAAVRDVVATAGAVADATAPLASRSSRSSTFGGGCPRSTRPYSVSAVLHQGRKYPAEWKALSADSKKRLDDLVGRQVAGLGHLAPSQGRLDYMVDDAGNRLREIANRVDPLADALHHDIRKACPMSGCSRTPSRLSAITGI